MKLEAASLDDVRALHPAWGLLEYAHAGTAIAFLHRAFIAPNIRSVSQPELVEALDDELFALRQLRGEQTMPRHALEYLVDWSSNNRGGLRRFSPAGSDEPVFDLTPACEQAITWVLRLADRPFVGTESRLRSLFDLLEQMAVTTETDPAVRLADLQRRRAELDLEIEQVQAGRVEVIDDRVLKERFHQFVTLARELLADFRQVEHNFRGLDRRGGGQMTGWGGAEGVGTPPADTLSVVVMPETATGVLLLVRVPSPNCPSVLLPQQTIPPLATAAQVWLTPADTLSAVVMPETVTSVLLLVRVPLPSCPTALLPQHRTPPLASTAQV